MEGSDLDVLGPVDYLVVEFPAEGGLCDSLRGESALVRSRASCSVRREVRASALATRNARLPE